MAARHDGFSQRDSQVVFNRNINHDEFRDSPSNVDARAHDSYASFASAKTSEKEDFATFLGVGEPQMQSLSDQKDMYRMGRKIELRRTFSILSCIGFSVVLGNSWEFALITGTYTLSNGGTAGTVWMFIITAIGMYAVTLSLAEMASITPSSGAQYHWVSEFAGPSFQKFLSFTVGWMAALGWQLCMTFVGYVGGQQFISLITLVQPDYNPPAWHAFLFTLGVTLFSILCNIFLVRKLAMLEGLMFLVHIAGFFFILVILWVMGPRHEAREVFTTFSNGNNWSSVALACLAGISSPVVTLIGIDSSCHLAEEMRNASWAVPRAMMMTAIISYSIGLVMVITIMFNITNFDAALDPSLGQSYVTVILEATKSETVTIFCTALVAFMMCSCGINQATTSSRSLYAFARDNDMALAQWVAHVRPGWDFPLNSVLVTLGFAVITSLIMIASNYAFTIITSLSVVGLLWSYLITIIVFFWRKLQPTQLPYGRFTMGRKRGLLVNAVAIAFLAMASTASFFPTGPDPTPDAMNWSVVVMGGSSIIFTAYYWIYGRNHYTPPVERLKAHEQ